MAEDPIAQGVDWNLRKSKRKAMVKEERVEVHRSGSRVDA